MTIIGSKWVFRNKLDENGIVSRNKARLVSQGYNQQEGINYDENYAPVAKHESIRILLAYACALDFKLFQMDIKSAFLKSFINEEVYVVQPSGFIDFEKPDHVYKLKKALYGLKQAPKAWSVALNGGRGWRWLRFQRGDKERKRVTGGLGFQEEHRTELGMLIQVKQGRLSATTATDLALNVDNEFQANNCDAFDSDVDEAPTTQTMFMANLLSVDLVYDEADLSYDSEIRLAMIVCVVGAASSSRLHLASLCGACLARGHQGGSLTQFKGGALDIC
ncbi:copia protein [Tanacetum coccineum]